MTATLDPSVESAEREIVLTRTFTAPRSLVWKAWTEPEHLIQWWGPNGFTNTFHQFNMVPGGVWLFTMHGPDGVDYPNRIVFDEIVEPERIAYTHGSSEEKPDQFKAVATFDEEGEKTTVTLRLILPSPEERQRKVESGAMEGGTQTLERLAQHLTTMEAGTKGHSGLMNVTLPSANEIVLTRTFNAPRPLVYEAVTKPEHVSRWWGPYGTSLSVCEIDLRVGGSWRYVIAGKNGEEVGFRGVYREIVQPERIVHTEIYEPYPDTEAIVTVLLTEADGKTTLTSTSYYPTEEIRDMVLQSGMEGGAAETFDRLAELLTEMA